MKKALFFLLLLPLLGFSQNANELLVRWEGTRINWSDPTSGPMYYNGSNTNMTAGNFTGNNVNLNVNYQGLQGENWPTATTPDYTKYFQFTVAPATGKKIEAKMFRFQQSGFCNRYQIRYSTNPAFPGNGTLLYESTNALATQNTYINAPFPAEVVVNSGEVLYVRIYGYQKDLYNHPWRIVYSNPENNVANTNGVAPGFYGVISDASTVSLPVVANNDTTSTVQGVAKNINVLENDTYSGTSITTVEVISAPANGNAVVQADKTITFTPAAGFTGNTTFQYKITGANGTTASATVSISVTFPPITGPLNGTYAIGSSVQSAYPQFQTITAAVNHLNANGVSGPVTFILNNSTYSIATGESFPITIDSFSGSSAANTLTIKPGAGLNVVIESANVNDYTGVPAVLKLNGADNIIIEGSNTTGSTTRNLTFFNKDNIGYIQRTVIWVASVGSNGATNITIKNTNIRQAFKNADGNFCVGVYSGANLVGSNNTMTVAAATANNSGLNITNNDFMNVKQGIYINGDATYPTTNVVVHQNDLGSENNTETIIQPACFSNVNGFRYTENLVYNLYRNSTSGSLTSAGIFITGNTKNGSILRNNMRNLTKTHSDDYTFAGITLASSEPNSNILVANNFIQNVAGKGNSDSSLNGHGINVASGGGYKIYFNTVKLETNQGAPGYSAALYVHQGVVGLDVRNNIFVNRQTAGIRRAAIMVKDSKANVNTIFTHLDYNNYYSLDQLGYIADGYTVGQINWPANPDYVDTLQEWKTVTGKDANSLNVNPVFVSATDLHLSSTNADLDNKGVAILGINRDIDGQVRGSVPDMGADEYGAVALPGQGVNPNTGIYCDASTTWNGTTWSNGMPTAEKDAIFTADFTQSGGTFTACSIFVTGTAKVLFTSKSNAVVTHNVNVEATASMTFESSCNLIQLENTQNVGTVTIKRFGSRLKKLDYTFWSSPVTGTQTMQQFSPATVSNRFYTYNTVTNTYMSLPWTSTFTAGKGVLIRMPNQIEGPQAQAYNVGGYRFAFEGIFTGTPNNGNVYVPLSYVSDTHSFNSVGNPYPSPISVTDFIDANIDNIEGTIWIWRKTNNPTQTSYCTLTKIGYVANNAPGGGGAGGNDGNDLIADPWTIDSEGVLNTGQGFIIKAKNTQDLVFRNNMRKAHNFASFFRNGNTAENEPETSAVNASRIWLNVTNAAEDVFAQAMVGYTAQATLGYDNGIDGRGFVDGTVSLYSVIEGERLTIQGRPAFDADDVVPLGFKTETAGEFIIKLDRFDGLFSTSVDIFLKDKQTGIIHDLRNGDYTFTTEVGTFENRFEIMYKNQSLSVNPVTVDAKDVVIYNQDRQVKVKSPEEIKSVIIYDIQGKIIYQNYNVNSFEFASSVLTVSQQVVIVNAVLANDQAVSKKIMVN